MMRIFPPALEITDTEGFDRNKDIFQRAELGAGLTNLVSRVSDPLVLAIDSQWGSGKTTFLKMWAGELRKAGYPVAYFDAFENDYLEDAFLAIAGQVISLAQKRSAGSAKAREFTNQAKSVGKVLARSALKIAIKGATLGTVDAADLGDLGQELADKIGGEAEQLLDKHIGELLTQQQKQKDTIQRFRQALSELPQALSDGGADEQGSTKPLIFVIDELDRCRPLFALQILERIKHFFAAPNVHFVLGAHLGQLRNSVTAAYGSRIDAHAYLQKFIHLTFILPERDRQRDIAVAVKFIEHLVHVMDFRPEDKDTVQGAANQIAFVASRRNLSLRTVERVMSNLALALAFSPKNYLRPPPIVGGLCVLKVIYPELYAKAANGSLSFIEVKKALGFGETTIFREDYSIEWYQNWWEYCLAEEIPAELKDFGRNLWQYNLRDRKDIIPLVVFGVIDRLVPRE